VLSACDVGRTEVRPGDEILGFTAALLHLGTATVISSVSRVDDETALAIMTAYHQALSAGVRPAEALARAAGQRGPDDDAGPDDAGLAGLAPDAALTPFVCRGRLAPSAGPGPVYLTFSNSEPRRAAPVTRRHRWLGWHAHDASLGTHTPRRT
jgi:hypothetical protein